MLKQPRTAAVCLLIVAAFAVESRGQSTLIPLTTRRDMVFDYAGKYLYITTSDGYVRPYNLSTNQLESGYYLGGSLNGVDIARDNSFLLIAQGRTSSSRGTFHKLDLMTGVVTNINYNLDYNESGSWDVAIGSNGLALVTCSGGPAPVREIDLASNAISSRGDAPGSINGLIVAPTQIHRSADGTRFYFLESSSVGPIFTYSASTNTFGSSAWMGLFSTALSAAVNRNGSLLATRFLGTALDTAVGYKFLHSFNQPDSGVAFDGMSDTLYAVSSLAGQIIAYDTATFTERFRINIGETVNQWTTQFDSGTLVASPNGHFLALETASGIRLITIPAVTPDPTPTPTPSLGRPRDVVFDHGGKYLYISTDEGFVFPYNLSSGALEVPYNLGGLLRGLDVAADDSFLLVAESDIGATQGMFQKVDLKTGIITNINYTRGNGEGGAWTVGVASNGLAFATTQWAWTPLRQIDLVTNAVINRTDAPGAGHDGALSGTTQIVRNTQGTRLYFFDEGIVPGYGFIYDTASNSFGPQLPAQIGTAGAAVNRDGTLLGARPYPSATSLETMSNFTLVHSFNFLDSGFAFDAVKDIFYGVNSTMAQIVAYDTSTFAEKFRFDIREDVNAGSAPMGNGTLVASQDGHYLALITPTAVRVYTVPAVQLVSVVSKKTHGSAGTFDINLPLDGPRAIECRSSGANGQYTLVFTFGSNLTHVGGASLTKGGGTVVGSGVDNNDAHRYIVNLSGVVNAQYIKVSLNDVNDAVGNHTDSISQELGVLVGDTTGNGLVNSSDISLTESQSGQSVTALNFREDVTLNGLINSSDVALVQSLSGSALGSAAASSSLPIREPASTKTRPTKRDRN